jgi:citrate lyase subunit beta/citryl-CoA lyase
MNQPVTYLFVPGNRPERFAKAFASSADAIILDLEDAVVANDKAAARENVARWMASTPAARDRTLVRVNAAGTAWFHADLELLRRTGTRVAMLPKADSAEQVALVHAALGHDGSVVPLIETARGVWDVGDIAAARGVQRLAFGTLDYMVDVGLSGDERGLAYPAARIAIASRAAGLASPVAGVTAVLDDEAALQADLAFARAHGFGAKLCIHPNQLAAVRAAFVPTDAELAWARRVLSAVEDGPGAIRLDGEMIDAPLIARARAIVARGESSGTQSST